MNGFKGILVDKFAAKTQDNIGSDNIIEYLQNFNFSTLDGSALVTKFMVVAAISAAFNNIEIPFTATLTINWQTDLADGTNTYAALYGNSLPLFGFYSDNGDGTFTANSPQMIVSRSSGLISTVVISQGIGNWILVL